MSHRNPRIWRWGLWGTWLHSLSSRELEMPATRAAGVTLEGRAALSPCIWLLMVLASQWKTTPFSHSHVIAGVIYDALFPCYSGDNLTQLKASLESYGLVKTVWGQLKSLSHISSEINTALLWFKIWHQLFIIKCLLCQHLTWKEQQQCSCGFWYANISA